MPKAILLFLYFYSCFVFGQSSDVNIKGQIFSEDGSAIGGVHIIFGNDFVLSNDSGNFEINSTEPLGNIIFKKAGYQSLQLAVNDFSGSIITLKKTRTDQSFNADSIISLAIEKALLNRHYHSSFKSNVYSNTKAFILKQPFHIPLISGYFIPSNNDSGLAYVNEKYAEIIFNDPLNYNETVKVYQSAGGISIPNWNFSEHDHFNLYEPYIFLYRISSVTYNSPLHHRAFRYYNFTPQDIYREGGQTIYRIKFEPKRKYSPNFHGFLDIYGDSLHSISSVQMGLSENNLLEVIDTFYLEQLYFKNNGSLKKASQKTMYFIDMMGFDGYYQVENYYDDFYFYLNEIAAPGPEVYTLKEENITFNNDIWDSVRLKNPDLQTKEVLEKEAHPTHSILFEQSYLSPFREREAFRWHDPVIGGYTFTRNKHQLEIPKLWQGLGYNLVEGFYLIYQPVYRYYFPTDFISVSPFVRYGLAGERVYFGLNADYLFHKELPSKINFKLGRSVFQFNEEEPISPLVNSLFSLLRATNHLKIYQKDYLSFTYQTEVINGMEFKWKGEYSFRQPLFNNTHFHLLGDSANFTPNNPDYENSRVIDPTGFREHQSLLFEISLNHQFNQLYKMIDGRKVVLPSTAPRVFLQYRKGLPTTFSQTNFDFLSGGVFLQRRMGHFGTSMFDISGGHFINRAYVPFMDFKHFNGMRIFLLQNPRRRDRLKEFSTLPYYSYSTKRSFIEMHYEHHFEGSLIGSGNYFSRFKLQSFAGVNYLNTLSREQFVELFIGLENILNIFRLEFAGGLDNFIQFEPSIRVGIDFNFMYYNRHRRN